MKFIKTDISGVFILEPKIYNDERGYFIESFNQKEFDEFLGYRVNFCQDNESKSSFGVLRGLHFQKPPYEQSKLVRVITGEVLDVAVDLREGSPTYGKSVSITLSEENKKQIFIPKGFAHGFVVLSEEAVFSYKVDNFYNQKSESGILFSDPELGIDWKVTKEQMTLSSKDKALPLLCEMPEIFTYKAYFNLG
ncbi:dTDP-4-dehydrorhamnose 3,5-epimerase [Vibrio coralliilyticus]|uniref:dTDP-4-dehydrorhamnose 3,5-epimerase n=1 Tax=Vibrio coralliilyticus TaxID=190893 RepID=UPI00148D3F83|nr:dTDP-4-dehydrorhamnose 3,5-epimerase [Vibrio coralliilyticus]NOH55543.1 dTDP-4-dehydrorhamnose 3,5-epimerase [Vibrio coralliilyticus]